MRTAAVSDSDRRKRLVMTGKKIAHWFEYALFATGIGLLIYVAMNYTFIAGYQLYLQRILQADPPPPFKARVAIPSKEGARIRRLESEIMTLAAPLLPMAYSSSPWSERAL